MPWKRDSEGHLELVDGNPVRIDATGHETAMPDSALDDTIQNLVRANGEAKARKLKIQEFEAKLKAFEGIEDLADWRKKAEESMDLAANLDAKKLIDAGEVEKVKGEVTKAMQAKVDELQRVVQSKDQIIKEKEGVLHQELIGGRFSRSKYLQDRVAIPPDLVQHRFGNQFQVKDGKVVAFDSYGNELYSKDKPGELADFEEAIEMVVNSYPHKDSILRGSDATGSGMQSGQGRSQSINPRVVNASDAKAFGANLDKIARGEVQVIRQ